MHVRFRWLLATAVASSLACSATSETDRSPNDDACREDACTDASTNGGGSPDGSDEPDGSSTAGDGGPSLDAGDETPTDAGTPIDPADIVDEAQANVPFAQQKGYGAQVVGTFVDVAKIPEDGIHGSKLSNGETLRLGKVDDPLGSNRKVFAFQLDPGDPVTAGSKRSEISFDKNIDVGAIYWVALRVLVEDWGTLGKNDRSLFGTQIHSGDDSLGLSPSFSINTTGDTNRQFEIEARYQKNLGQTPSQSNTTFLHSDARPIAFGQWMDFVFVFRQSLNDDGFLRAWLDGNEIWNYEGKIGFQTPGHKDYFKFGYYNWSADFASRRKVHVRSPIVVRDPSGAKYGVEDLLAYVHEHG